MHRRRSPASPMVAFRYLSLHLITGTRLFGTQTSLIFCGFQNEIKVYKWLNSGTKLGIKILKQNHVNIDESSAVLTEIRIYIVLHGGKISVHIFLIY